MTAVLIIIGVVALIAAGLGIFFFLKKTKDVRKGTEKETETKTKKMGENTKPSKPEFKEKEEKPTLTLEEKEEKKKKEASRHIQKISQMGIAKASEVSVNEDSNGTLVVGIVFNEKSKVYLFNPKDFKLNIGDVVVVKDLSDTRRTVPVVLGNTYVRSEDIVQPFKDVEEIVYQVGSPVEVVKKPKYTVTFNSLGHGLEVEALTELDAMPEELPLLSEEGYEFEGWYKDEGFNDEAVFGEELSSDVTLYAKWTLVVVEAPKYTVTFDNMGHGNTVSALVDVEVLPDRLPQPADLDFEFGGWFKDPELTIEALPSEALDSDLTLYAKWDEAVSAPEAFKIRFNNMGHGTVFDHIVDSKIPSPLPEPVEEGFNFGGWFMDEGFTTPAEAGKQVFEEVTLYAKWTLVEKPKFKVEFNNMGHGYKPEDLLTDKLPSEFPLLSEEGYEFEGWYYDVEFDKEAEFDSILANDVVLYARWIEIKQEEPVVLDKEEVEDDDSEDEDEKEESGSEGAQATTYTYDEITKKYHVIRVKKTYEAKISLLDEETKEFYDQIRNKFKSYKGIKHSLTKTIEKFKFNKEFIALMKVSGKQVAIYLALDPKALIDSKYKGKDVSDKKAYQNTPFLYKTRTQRKTTWAMELIDMWANKFNLELNPDYKDEKYAVNYPKMSDEELIKKGYMTRTEEILDEAPKGFVRVKELEETKTVTVEVNPKEDNKEE